MPRKRSTAVLTHWSLKGQPVTDVIAEIEKLEPHLQPWVGRVVWWDRFSEGIGGDADPGPWRKWLERRNDPDVTPEELQKALVQVGYTEAYAGLRSGAKLWNTGRPKGVALVQHKPPPDGLTWPVEFPHGVRMRRINNGKERVIYQMYFVGQAAIKRRTGSVSYWTTLEMCVTESRKRGRVNEQVPVLTNAETHQNEN